ncbi:MAG: NADH-quinone oxidoreductase subunit J [Chloroflexi bacterium]|nr:NADH-quinone oxidoreductase subunit J [Chloroflexota bacterium]
MTPTGLEVSPFFTLVWWVTAIGIVVAAWSVVFLRDVLKAALALIGSFLGVAGMFVMLNAEFLAAIQVLLYAGAISILIIFAVLLTRDVFRGNPSNRFERLAFFLAGALMFFLTFVIIATPWGQLKDAQLSPEAQAGVAQVFSNTTPIIGQLLVQEYVLPFEVASVLLLAAILGAIVLVREE